MKTHLIRIGNSRGVRIPKLLIEQCGLTDEVELHVQNGTIIIARSKRPRSGWVEAAKQMHENDDDVLLDPPINTRFDDTDWEG